MSQSSPAPRVKGGLPWWLWVLLSFATVAVVVGVAVSSAPDDPQALFDDIVEELSSDTKAAKAKLDRLRSFDEYKWHVQYIDGILAFREMRDPRALKLLAEIPDGHELKPKALKQMGDSYLRTRQYQKSMEAYQKAVEISPDTNVDARVALAGMYLGIGAHQLAEQVLNEAIAKDPAQSTALEARAMSRATEERYVEAVQDFRKILSTPGEFSAATPNLLTAYGNAILKVQDEGLIQEAVDEYLSLFEQTEQKMALLIAVGKLDEAEDAASPEGEPASMNDLPHPVQKKLALIEIERGEWKKAEKIIRPLIPIMPRDLELFEMAARVYKELNDTPRQAVAEENAKQLKDLRENLMAGIKSVGNNIDNADGRAAVARTYMQLADFNSAVRWFAVAVTLDNKHDKEMAEASSGSTYPRAPFVEFPSEIEEATAPAVDGESDTDTDAPAGSVPPEKEASSDEAPAKSDAADPVTPTEAVENAAPAE